VYWAWKLTTPIWNLPHSAGVTHDQAVASLGIITYLTNQQAIGTNRAASLFVTAEASSQTQPKKQENSNRSPKTEPAKDPGKSPPPAVRKTITLTYRGLYVRGDRVTEALITDSQSQRSAFYPAESHLFGLILTSIEAETLGVKLPDQSSATLKRGVPQSFPGSPHAN